MTCLHEKGIGVNANPEIVTVCRISSLFRGRLKQAEIPHYHLLVFHHVEAGGASSSVHQHLHLRD